MIRSYGERHPSSKDLRRVLFIDRDGTIIVEPKDTQQIDHIDKLAFLPDVIDIVKKIVDRWAFDLVMITNQDGLGTSLFPEETFWPAQNQMMAQLHEAGIVFKDILIDRTLPEAKAWTRKPGTGLLTHYMDSRHYDMSTSVVIGDRLTDMELASNLGAKGILLKSTESIIQTAPAAIQDVVLAEVDGWSSLYEVLSDFAERPARYE